MNRNKNRDLIERTKRFPLLVIELYNALPKSTVAQVLGKQLLRSGTSVGSQYREAQRAKSDADFISKTDELIAIFVSIVKKVKGKGKKVQPSSFHLHPSELECEV